MANGRDDRDKSSEGEKSCCTWPKVLVTAVVLIVVGVLIWQFAPIDTAINNVLPTFNNTSGGGSSESKPPVPSPTPAPTEPQVESYKFMQCSEDSIANNECCNGLDNICDLGVDDVMYATVHNAMATFEDGFLFGPNHRYQLESALEAGYRGINLDACNCGGNHVFCHGVCSLGTRDINEVFTNINSFVDDNPTEIVFIIIQINNQADQQVDLNVLYDITVDVPGFTDKMYDHGPDPSMEWPTLRQARDDNDRIMLFHYNAPACNVDTNPCPPGMHQYFDYATNNAWEASSLTQLRETSRSCPLSRTPGIAGTTFFGVNNFVTPPSQTSAQSANSLQFARSRVDTCSSTTNLAPNFVYVDFWFEGNIPQFTQEHNSALGDAQQRQLTRKQIRLGRS